MERIVRVLSLIACVYFHISDATLCKPHSEFKLDCNSCTCSSDGMQFSCTRIICEPLIYKDKYLIDQNEKGYTILKPKPDSNTNTNRLNQNNDLFNYDPSASNQRRLRRGQRYVLPIAARYPDSETIGVKPIGKPPAYIPPQVPGRNYYQNSDLHPLYYYLNRDEDSTSEEDDSVPDLANRFLIKDSRDRYTEDDDLFGEDSDGSEDRDYDGNDDEKYASWGRIDY